MSNDWVKVWTVGNIQLAQMIKGMLLENGIESNIMNKRDSEFKFGDIELYVQKTDEVVAKKLINEHNETE
jgi:hypothetical protein